MEPGALTHLDRVIIAAAVIGGVVCLLLPVILVLIASDTPRLRK